jgi:Tfp pilus assembly pilus retraction ATPase PilT
VDKSDPANLDVIPQPPTPEIKVSRVPGPDFTTYRGREFEEQLPKKEILIAAEGGVGPRVVHKIPKHYSGALTIRTSKDVSIPARALACSSYRGRFWSITLRSEEENERPALGGNYDTDVKLKLTKNKRTKKVRSFLGYCPKGYGKYPELPKSKHTPTRNRPGKSAIFLNDLFPLCSELYDILLNPKVTPHPSGLIVITGATDSSKSIVTRGLIFLFLEAVAKKARKTRQRRPHLVTFEDPIEQYYIRDPDAAEQMPADNPANLEKLLDAIYIDYTPREKEKDADSLKQVTQDALRQTPAVLFVGETRERNDWRELIEFAGSGHLVVTTSHANSVVEAMGGIFRDTDTKTPAQRSDIARRILGVINIRSYTTKNNIRALVPSVWKRTDQSVSDLIADGLASILPAPETGNQERAIGYYGRSYLAAKLTASKHLSKKVQHEKKKKQSQGEALEDIEAIKNKALEWDLKGV